MNRSRKGEGASVRLTQVARVVVCCLLIGSAGVGYVWQKNQIYALSQQKKQKEMRLEDLRRENKRHRDRLDYLRLPWVLEARARELNLGLGAPLPEQVLHLVEPVVVVTNSPFHKQFAARRSESLVTR